MNVRDKINELAAAYLKSLNSVVDGKATVQQQADILNLLSEISFYTNTLMLFNNDDLSSKSVVNPI